MSKKILLIDVDSKIPNLALMKISKYHKDIGDDVSFSNTDDPDIVYASIIFKKNKHLVDGLKFFYPKSKIIIGGSGYNIKVKLSDDIENMKPDYSLYLDMDYSIGYSTRGCNRNCSFCIVPEKEGKYRRAQHPNKWFNPDFDKIVFLDNNILLDKEWFFEITDFCIENDLKTWFTQGLDIRMLDQDVADRLRELPVFKSLFFAWDNIADEEIIKHKIDILKKAGINVRSNVVFYVYCDSVGDYDSALHRCRTLKNLKTSPFVMFNIDKTRNQKIKDLQRWANRKQAFWSCDIADYSRKGCTK
jgi:hypothetical protein